MGDPKKARKHFELPHKMWDRTRVEKEGELVKKFGLKKSEEIWRVKSQLGQKRTAARSMLALTGDLRNVREKELIKSLQRVGLLSEEATLDDVLGLGIENFMERRLQTLLVRKGMVQTMKQARQLIVHGHVAVGGKRMNAPGYLVKRGEENHIAFFHPEIAQKIAVKEEEKKTRRGRAAAAHEEGADTEGKEEARVPQAIRAEEENESAKGKEEGPTLGAAKAPEGIGAIESAKPEPAPEKGE